MVELTPGGNAPLSGSKVTVRVISGLAADISSFRLYDSGKVRGDADMVFYGQKQNDDTSIQMISDGTNSAFTVDLSRMRSDVQRIAFTATAEQNAQITSLRSLEIQVEVNGQSVIRGQVELQGRPEAALILGELYRRNQEWKFRFISQGFNGGLQPLAEHFGVDIDSSTATSAPTSAPAPTPTPAAPPISLSKVSLTKEAPRVNLAKKDNFGVIKVNLDWNQGKKKTGLFARSSGIDLDIGAFVKTRNGNRDVIQALGERFGSMNSSPYVELQGDDRTGAVTGGEWLHISGQHWQELEEVLIFAFIYQGTPSWENTDGVVTIHIPGQGPIETRLTDGNNRQGMCAIARLSNVNGSIEVERINQYFSGHKELDKAFGWGFSWGRGSK
ncbi:MAG: TerD family protein [Oceanisphaera sp.]|uniref:TerD family protein n=1 Tax=Oceanisphaera sp. TaxID=1929979 RepID=UPI003C7182D6